MSLAEDDKTPDIQLFLRGLVMQDVAEAQAAYEIDQNPVHAWVAIAACVQHNIDLPAWITGYLLRVSMALGVANPPGFPGGSIEKHVLRALEMRTIGAGNIFARYKQKLKEREVFVEVSSIATEHPDRDLERIYEDIANAREREGLDEGLIKKYYLHYARMREEAANSTS